MEISDQTRQTVSHMIKPWDTASALPGPCIPGRGRAPNRWLPDDGHTPGCSIGDA